MGEKNKELKLRVGSKKPAEANYRVVNENKKIRPYKEYGKPKCPKTGEYGRGVKAICERGFLTAVPHLLVKIDI